MDPHTPAERDLIAQPAWRAREVGLPMPVNQHACSVCLPKWADIIGYCERRERVMNRITSGYPRFIFNSLLNSLTGRARESIARNQEQVFLFPNREAAQRAQRYVERRQAAASRIASFDGGLQALVVDQAAHQHAMEYWRYSGEIVSSRQAEDILNGTPAPDASQALPEIASRFHSTPANFYLTQSGMAAIYTAHRIATALQPLKKTLQIDFPYVDTFAVQKNFGSGVVFLTELHGESFQEALGRISAGEFAAIFVELPSNPLLQTPDLPAISAAARQSNTPLIVDETVATHHNLDAQPYADILTASLTKWFTSSGDVMAGSLRLNPDSPLASELRAALDEAIPDHSTLYPADTLRVLHTSGDFAQRMETSNHHGEMVAHYLREHPAVDQVYYPSLHTREHYDRIKRPDGGYGGLISFTVKAEKKMPKVHDNLRWCKGPSFGTQFSLASPYTLMAHYQELDWASACGVSPHLLRLSIGLEEPDHLLNTLAHALEHA